MKQRRALLLVLAALALIIGIWCVLWVSHPQAQTLDQRVQAIGSQLKCLICQGESVADSPSQLAQQMRQVIRERLQEGQSPSQIIASFRQSYGDQIIWSPPWQGFSLLAWLVPIVFLLAGALLVFFVLREWLSGPAVLAHEHTTQHMGDTTPEAVANDPELDSLRARLEAELASDDILFRTRHTSGRKTRTEER